MVQCLVLTSTLLIMPTVTASQSHALACTTLFLLQCRTRKQSWPGLTASHLMRWRYFILTLLNKYKKNHFINYGHKTCSYINILTTLKKCNSQCIFPDNVENLSFFLFLIFNLLNTRQEHSPCLFIKFFYVILFLVKESKIDNDFFVLPVNYWSN